jgi:formylglycine-generating enzyme
MTMKQTRFGMLLLAALHAQGFLVAPAVAQAPVITSFGWGGQLTVSNLLPGTVASVEWAPAVTGPWTNSWASLAAVTTAPNGTIQVSVPMFYRIRGIAAPVGMALIPVGTFTMGDSLDGRGYELPLRQVQVSAFYMDRYEVTKALWDDVYQWAITNGYGFSFGAQGKAASHPAHSMTWYDAVKWCNARSEREGRVPAYYTDAAQTIVYRTNSWDLQNNRVKWNQGYRLPTEAEWEKAARGGVSGHRFPWADVDTISQSQANYRAIVNSPYDLSYPAEHHPTFAVEGMPYTSPVGSFPPNGYGLYDLAGNLWEMCWDWDGGYASGPQTDPRGPLTGSDPYAYRMMRGGSWDHPAFNCTVANRFFMLPNQRSIATGFRSVLPLSQP